MKTFSDSVYKIIQVKALPYESNQVHSKNAKIPHVLEIYGLI